jgi:hypothetical protein
MTEIANAGKITCPWCHNRLDIIRSGKTGFHYANCGSCNAHFRNIPLAIINQAHNGTGIMQKDNAPTSTEKDNVVPISDNGKPLDEKLAGIPRNLWKYLQDEEDNA